MQEYRAGSVVAARVKRPTCCRTLTRSFITLRRRLFTTTAAAKYLSRCCDVVCTAFRYLWPPAQMLASARTRVWPALQTQ